MENHIIKIRNEVENSDSKIAQELTLLSSRVVWKCEIVENVFSPISTHKNKISLWKRKFFEPETQGKKYLYNQNCGSGAIHK